MSTPILTRRAALATLGALALPSAIGVESALAQPPIRFRAIEVDVAPLRANVGDPTAEWVQQTLPGALAQALAPYMAPGDRNGASLVARIDNLYLGPSSGGVEPGGSVPDWMAGVLLVRGPRGAVAAETPLRATSFYYPSPVDQALVVQANYDRVFQLARAFAGWAPRQLGL
jgi:hypothetical protein